MFKRTLVACGILLACTSNARAAVINFDDLGNGVTVTNQYAALATFSSEAGYANLTTAQNLGSSLPNFICTAAVGAGIDCAHETIVNFAGAVDALSFLGIGVNDVGVVARVDVFVNGVFDSTIAVIGAGNAGTPVLVDLGAFNDVTGIRIHGITDAAGIGWDDFTFQAAAVPEPGLLMLLGSGLAAAAIRRRR